MQVDLTPVSQRGHGCGVKQTVLCVCSQVLHAYKLYPRCDNQDYAKPELAEMQDR